MFAPAGYAPFTSILGDALDDSLYQQAKDVVRDEAKSIISFAVQRKDDLILRWVLDYCVDSLHIFDPSSCRVMAINAASVFGVRHYVDISGRTLSELPSISIPANIKRDFNLCDPLTEEAIDAFNSLVDKFYSKNELVSSAAEKEILSIIDGAAETNGFTKAPMLFASHSGRISFSLLRVLATEPRWC
ncbi:hypothetical protein [Paracoccus aminovorans]|uniref:hypothetical protein n=1 Tax=Paracoccus aminovorans TaxID=34004 RepID=UPI0012E34598|nr:hypothetical protein [Paracoccus aminovorans]